MKFLDIINYFRNKPDEYKILMYFSKGDTLLNVDVAEKELDQGLANIRSIHVLLQKYKCRLIINNDKSANAINILIDTPYGVTLGMNFYRERLSYENISINEFDDEFNSILNSYKNYIIETLRNRQKEIAKDLEIIEKLLV